MIEFRCPNCGEKIRGEDILYCYKMWQIGITIRACQHCFGYPDSTLYEPIKAKDFIKDIPYLFDSEE